jgi:dimethylhistidine N-methyltransferase
MAVQWREVSGMNARSSRQSEFAQAVLDGLARPQKALSPKFLYDHDGSELFERICDCPEYYITRTEMRILADHAPRIASLVGERAAIIELGSGASRKTRILLDGLPSAGAYVPIDISLDILLESARELGAAYPGLRILPVCADFTSSVPLPWHELPDDCERSLVFFPGSTLGNFEPAEVRELLGRIADLLEPGGQLLLGADLVKHPGILNAAYNDAQGVTAEFNLNLLRRMRRELNAELDLHGFAHHAYFNSKKSRIEMHLVSLRRQTARVFDVEFRFEAGETIHTENSYKYTPESLSEVMLGAGLERRAFWSDPQRLFGVGLFEKPRAA